MKKVDTDALQTVDLALGLTGRGASDTEFSDGLLDQTVDVNPYVRRGRADSQREGLWTFSMANVHGALGNLSLTVDPYNVPNDPPGSNPSNSGQGYPSPVPRGFDLWFINATAATTVTGAIDRAVLFLNFPTGSMAFESPIAGSVAPFSASIGLGWWDSSRDLGTAWRASVARYGYISGSGDNLAVVPRPTRIPRGSSLQWYTDATAAATIRIEGVLGLFPLALGQDGSF